MTTYSVQDKFIDVLFYRGDDLVYSIETPLGGVKPTLGFTIKLLPGYQCYQCELKVKNLNIPVIELRTWTRMRITAGYRTRINLGNTEAKYLSATPVSEMISDNENTQDKVAMSMDCPLFAAYPESPNPDGVTTFLSLVVGKVDSKLDNDVIDVHIYGEITIGQLIQGVKNTLGVSLKMSQFVQSEEFQDLVITSESLQNAYAENSYALVAWLARTLNDTGKGLVEQHDIRTVLWNSELYIWDNKDPSGSKQYETVHDLNRVTKASYVGTMLNVEAPWLPELIPGSLFQMPNNYYSAPQLYNEIDASAYTGENSVYRVVTMSVAFSTTGNENSMSIMALPVQYLRSGFYATSTEDELKTTIDKRIQEYTNYANDKIRAATLRNHKVLSIGTSPNFQVPTDSLWMLNWTYTPLGSPYRIKDLTGQPSSAVWMLAAVKAYGDHSHVVTAQEAVDATNALNADARFSSLKITISEGLTISPECYWPFVMYATYKNMSAELANNTFDYENPGALYNYSLNMNIYYRQITSEKDFASGKEILIKIYEYFRDEVGVMETDILITAFVLGVIQ